MPNLTRLLPLLLLLAAAPAAGEWELDAGTWARPRHGDWLTQQPQLAGAVRELLATPDGRLLLRYAGGEAGSLWASEMQAWLVALGVPSDRIERVPGGVPEDRIQLQVVKGAY